MQDGIREPLLGGSAEHARPDQGRVAEGAAARTSEELARRIALCIYWSLAANIALLIVKTAAFLFSGSMAVLASAVDSLIDLASQAVISLADRAMARKDQRYPAGKARLEPISVLACAFIMSLASLAVVQECAAKLAVGIRTGVPPSVEMTPTLLCVLGVATGAKLALWLYCAVLRQLSGAAEALAEDHLKDVASIAGSILTAWLATWRPGLWWADPMGGILVSAAIVFRWSLITANGVAKVVGVEARPELKDLVASLARSHHPAATAAFVRAYHAGQRVAVDCELEAPGELSIQEAAAISQGLKQKLEALSEVEAASVVVLPRGAHPTASQPALLPPTVAKPPGQTDGAEQLEGAASVLAAATAALAERVGWEHAPLAETAAAARAATAAEGEKGSGASDTPGVVEAPLPGAGHAPSHVAEYSQQLGPPPALPRVHSVSAPPSMRVRSAGHEAGTPASSPRSPGSSFAEHCAWLRSLRDRPDRGLKSASFRCRDELEGPALEQHSAQHVAVHHWQQQVAEHRQGAGQRQAVHLPEGTEWWQGMARQAAAQQGVQQQLQQPEAPHPTMPPGLEGEAEEDQQRAAPTAAAAAAAASSTCNNFLVP